MTGDRPLVEGEPSSRRQPEAATDTARLAERDAAIEGDIALDGSWNAIDDVYLEFSREQSRTRGLLLALGVLSCIGALFGIRMVSADNWRFFAHGVGPGLVIVAGAVALALIGAFAIRVDTRMPRDEPVRFNRRTGKVYALSMADSFRGLVAGRPTVEVFDWNALQARQRRYWAFNGRFPVERHALELTTAPASQVGEVPVIWLVRNASGLAAHGFASRWRFLRAYMAGGDLATLRAAAGRRPTHPSLLSSLLQYLPFLDLSPQGRAWTREPLLLALMVLVVLASPLLAAAAICRWSALALSPPARWPVDLDTASRDG